MDMASHGDVGPEWSARYGEIGCHNHGLFMGYNDGVLGVISDW